MTYVIGEPCVDVLDRACVEECPVDCIYEGERMLYIHPDECVDCGACEPVCPVEAIYYEDDLPDQWKVSKEENAPDPAVAAGVAGPAQPGDPRGHRPGPGRAARHRRARYLADLAGLRSRLPMGAEIAPGRDAPPAATARAA